MTKRWIDLIVAIMVFAGTLGAVLATTFFQASREVDSVLAFRAVNVLADENLGLYHDAQGTEPVTFLEFPVLDLQPPLRRSKESGAVSVYIRIESGIDLFLIEPCGDVLVDGRRIGLMGPELFDTDERLQGRMCDRPGVKLAPGEIVRARVAVDHLDPDLEPADYAFTTVLGTVGRAIQPPDGVVSWWPGDGNANDIMDGNHGTLTGDFAERLVGEAFSLDGTGDLVLVLDSANLNITGDVAVDLWAKRISFGGIVVMVNKRAGAVGGSDAPSVYTLSFDADDRVQAGFERGDSLNVTLSGPAVTDDAFHHYAYLRSGNTHKLVMDGEVAASGDFTGQPGDTSGLPLVIGALRQNLTDFSSFFGGVIDEVEIFNRALSVEEIKAIYEAGSAGKIKPPQPAPTPAPGPTATAAPAPTFTPAPLPTATPTIDNTAPTVALTYNPDRDVRDADTLTITATFSEVINGTPTIAIDTTGTDLTATNMIDSGNQTVWEFSYDVPAGSDGTAMATIAGATDSAGEPQRHGHRQRRGTPTPRPPTAPGNPNATATDSAGEPQRHGHRQRRGTPTPRPLTTPSTSTTRHPPLGSPTARTGP